MPKVSCTGSSVLTARSSVKVGDLVKCVSANGVIGLVVELRRGATTPMVFDVLIGNKSYPFLPHQVEPISESR